jgi:hypothetical protein
MSLHYPIFSNNYNSQQPLKVDQDYNYNPTTNTLNVNNGNIKVSNILDSNNSTGNSNDILMKNNNNLLIWSPPKQVSLSACSFSQYNYYIKTSFSIPANQSQILTSLAISPATFTMENSFINTSIRRYFYMAPFSSDVQQYAIFMTSTANVDINVYKADGSSRIYSNPINLINIKNHSNVSLLTSTAFTFIKISKNDLIFIVISNKNNREVNGYIDYNILFM